MEKRILAPAELCESFYGIGERKAGLPLGRMLMLAIYGGMFIALAGVASTWASMLVENLSLRRLIAGCVFPAGLAMVVITGVELFTGNNLMTIAWLEKRITLKAMLRNWVVVYFGNLIGAVFIAALAVFGGVFISVTSGFSFTDALYESVSAIATVGLSSAGSANLSIGAQFLIILYMYFGRVGVLTISLGFLVGDRSMDRFRYAETRLMIG